MHEHEQGSQHGLGDNVAEMKSAIASANEREDDKERKNDEVEARDRPEHPPARKEDDCCPDVSTVRDAQSSQADYTGSQQYKQETKIEFIVMLRV
jgi:hypothetical protein